MPTSVGEIFIHSFTRALDLAGFYEPGDRPITAITDPLADALQAVDPGGEAIVQIYQDNLFCGRTHIPTGGALMQHMVARKITKIVFPPYTARNDLWTLLVILALSPDDLDQMNGVMRSMKAIGGCSIVVHERRTLPSDGEEFADPPWAERAKRRRGGTRVRDKGD